MGEQAPKEPSMEEILASIRKIISEDGDAPAEKAKPEPFVNADKFEPLLDDTQDHKSAFDDLAEDIADEVIDDQVQSQLAALKDEPVVDETFAEDASVVDDQIAADADAVDDDEKVEETGSAAQPDIKQQLAALAKFEDGESDMPTSAKYQETVLTEESTADTAAGALGKLISKMEFGGENTIEGLVRELLKPMVKDWLDANLPRIVDEKVEAEVQRIARMAR